MLRSTFCLAMALCITNVLQAQNYTLKGTVQNAENKSIPAVVVSLLKATDSAWVQSNYTGDGGDFTISNIPGGNYLLNVTALPYKTVFEHITISGDKTIAITLQRQASELKEVTVSSKKPFIENDLGKTIVNVDASILSAGTNVLELLKKAPGVVVDPNNNISLQGKKGVLVLIDGRETYLSGDGLSDYLKTLSSDQVAQLELITQPSARYDAEGVAGIINIKTKKNRNDGFNGTASAAYGQGFYHNSNEDVMLNYRKNKLNMTANISQYDGIGWMRTGSNRTALDLVSGAPLTTFHEQAEAKEIFANTQVKLGGNYAFSDKVNAGTSVTGIYHPNHEIANSTTQVTDLASSNEIHSVAVTPDHFVRQNLIVNSYLKYDVNKETNMTFDANFLDYQKMAYQTSYNNDYNTQNQQVGELNLDGVLPTSVNVMNVKGDLVTMAKKDFKIETGFKSSFAQVDDNAQYTLIQNNVRTPDTTRSNHFIYKENINALYVSARKSLGKKWEAQGGLRAEETNIDGTQTIGNKHFTSSSLSLFPTAFVSYKPNDKHQFEVNFGRRIERPGYQQLNPFIHFVDEYNYGTGNPQLKPQFSYYAEVKHTYHNELSTALSYRYATNLINEILKADPVTQATVRTQGNVAELSSIALSASYNKQLFKWWQVSAGGEMYYVTHRDTNISMPSAISGTGEYMYCNMQLTLGKGWSAEGEYYVSGKSVENIMTYGLPNQNMDFGVAKKLLHDTASIKMNISDPFNVNSYGQEFAGNGISGDYNFKWHSRSCGVTFTYNFGKKYEHKQTNVDITDDTKRVNM